MNFRCQLASALGMLWAVGGAHAGSSPADTCHVQVTISGADGVVLVNALGQTCPCASGTVVPLPGCGGGEALVLRDRTKEAAAWPRAEFVARVKRADELFIRATGTNRPIVIELELPENGSGCEGSSTMQLARGGDTLWWRASWRRGGARTSCRLELHQLRGAPKIARKMHL